jgi:hypothetical protein
MWKLYDQTRVRVVFIILLSTVICDPMTQNVNCDYELPGQANKCIYRKYFHSQTEHCRAGSITICYAGMMLPNLQWQSNNTKVLLRRITCNSLFSAYHTSTFLCELNWKFPIGTLSLISDTDSPIFQLVIIQNQPTAHHSIWITKYRHPTGTHHNSSNRLLRIKQGRLWVVTRLFHNQGWKKHSTSKHGSSVPLNVGFWIAVYLLQK